MSIEVFKSDVDAFYVVEFSHPFSSATFASSHGGNRVSLNLMPEDMSALATALGDAGFFPGDGRVAVAAQLRSIADVLERMDDR